MPAPTPPDRAGETAWHALDPLTRLVVAVATMSAAALLTGVLCSAVLALLAVVLPALVARAARLVLPSALLLSLPLGLSVVVVNVVFAVGSTEAGIALAVEVVARVLTMAGAAVLFYATTRPSQLVASLQHHGVPARATFVIHHGVATIPRLAQRAREVAEAQRARGLDTEGSPWRRVRGLLALASPTILGAVHEVETRTLALESRGFTRPGRPTLLWTPADGPWQRLARWGMAVALVLLAAARAFGALTC